MPGRSGIDILKDIDAQRYGAPIFIVSAKGDIPMAVDAIRKRLNNTKSRATEGYITYC